MINYNDAEYIIKNFETSEAWFYEWVLNVVMSQDWTVFYQILDVTIHYLPKPILVNVIYIYLSYYPASVPQEEVSAIFSQEYVNKLLRTTL